MEMMSLAIRARVPFVWVTTDDTIHIQEVLDFYAGEETRAVTLPKLIEKAADLKFPAGQVFFTSSECKSLGALYRFCVANEYCLVFVNTEKSVLFFDAGQLVTPIKLIEDLLTPVSENPQALLPAFGGLTLKDAGEVAKMTMTRDGSLTIRGVNTTRRGYHSLKGITQVDTNLEFYDAPLELAVWCKQNKTFFTTPPHPSLVPRGLLFDGPPGTGKTMAAKEIARNFGVPLYRMDIGAMKGKYVGDSEGNLMAALGQVDQVEPCVVLFDEVEKVFASQSDSGVTSSLLSQLLWWLQEHKSRVFTVMTTNDKSSIPPELFRPGRIDDVMVFLGIENPTKGYEFTKAAFDSMLDSMDCEVDEEAYKPLFKKVTSLFSDGKPVPQVDLTTLAYNMIKEAMSPEEGEDVSV